MRQEAHGSRPRLIAYTTYLIYGWAFLPCPILCSGQGFEALSFVVLGFVALGFVALGFEALSFVGLEAGPAFTAHEPRCRNRVLTVRVLIEW